MGSCAKRPVALITPAGGSQHGTAQGSAGAPRRRPGSGRLTGVRWTANEPIVVPPQPVYARMTSVPRKTPAGHAIAGLAGAWPATGVGAPARPRAAPARGKTRG